MKPSMIAVAVVLAVPSAVWACSEHGGKSAQAQQPPPAVKLAQVKRIDRNAEMKPATPTRQPLPSSPAAAELTAPAGATPDAGAAAAPTPSGTRAKPTAKSLSTPTAAQ